MHQGIIELLIMNIYGNQGRSSFAIRGPEVLSVRSSLAPFRKAKSHQNVYHFRRCQRWIGPFSHKPPLLQNPFRGLERGVKRLPSRFGSSVGGRALICF